MPSFRIRFSQLPHVLRLVAFPLTLLAIEFLDELVYGAGQAAWPVIRDDLGLSYVQIGALLSLPGVVSSLIEPFIGIAGDIVRPGGSSLRRTLILSGGVVFMVALLLTAVSQGFISLLIAFLMFYPASGAFVSLSQAALMDADPTRHEQNMARWTFAGSLGVVAGPIVLSAALVLGPGWRGLYLVFAIITVILVIIAKRYPFTPGARSRLERDETLDPGHASSPGLKTQHLDENRDIKDFKSGFLQALSALRKKEILRWLVLLEFSDLMLDVLYGFLALYFVDVVGITATQAAMAVSVWLVVGLAGDFLLIPLLERVSGLVYLRFSVILELILFPAFLLVPTMWGKLILLGFLGLFNAGWYAVLKGRLYTAMPGQSGTVMAVTNVAGLVGSIIPLILGFVAQRYNIEVAMWILLLGPIALLIGIPKQKRERISVRSGPI
jgi:FSR family fosmidomycin resistance protein-like MFS transporter